MSTSGPSLHRPLTVPLPSRLGTSAPLPPLSPPPPTFSSFFNDPDGDILVLTSDNMALALARFHLQSASPILQDVLAAPPPPTASQGGGGRETCSLPGQAAQGRLEVLRVDEPCAVIELALRLLHRELGVAARETFVEQTSSTSLLSLFDFANKYQIPLLTHTVFDLLLHSPPFVNTFFLDALGLAVVFGSPLLAAAAFRARDGEYEREKLAGQFSLGEYDVPYVALVPPERAETTTGFIPSSLASMDEGVFRRLSVRAVRVLVAAENQINHTPGATWVEWGERVVGEWDKNFGDV